MNESFQRGETTPSNRRSFFPLVSGSDASTPVTGAIGKINFTKAGVTSFTSSNNITEINSGVVPGRYYIEFTQTELDTLGEYAYQFITASCLPVFAQVSVVDYSAYSSGSSTTDLATAIWATPTRSLTVAAVTSSVDTTAIAAGVWASATRSLTTVISGTTASVDNNAVASAVWAASTRALTTPFPTSSVVDTSSIATAVWNSSTRSLTTPFPTSSTATVDSNAIATAVWNSSNRSLTVVTGVTASVDTTALANAILDQPNGVEVGLTLRQAMRLFTSVLAGRLTGAGTTTIRFRDFNNTKDRVVSTGDGTGNRTNISTDLT